VAQQLHFNLDIIETPIHLFTKLLIGKKMDKKPTYDELEKEVQELREAAFRNDSLERIYNTTTNSIMILDADQNIISANRATENLARIDSKELKGKKCFQIFHHTQSPVASCPMQKMVTAEKIETTEMEVEAFEKSFHISYLPVFDKLSNLERIIHIGTDITESKRTEKALQENIEKYTRLFHNSNDSILIHDLDGNIIDTNKKATEVFGYTKSEMLSIKIPMLHPSKMIINSDRAFKTIIQEGVVVFEIEFMKKRGEVFSAEVSSSLFNINGKKVIQGIVRDMTARKRVEEEKRQSEENFKALFSACGDGILVAEIDSMKFLEANPAICKMLGYSKSELLSKTIKDIHPIESLESVIKEFNAQARGEKLVAPNIPCLTKKRSIFFADISTVKTTIMGRDCNIGFFRDVTIQRQLEEKLFRSQKMESLGLLAGGVAHDLNNILSGIVSYPELILLDLPEGSNLRKAIKTIQESGQRAAAIVQELLTIARGVTITKEPLNINDIIRDYLESPEFKTIEKHHPTVTVTINLESNLLNIKGSKVQISKVLMNLVLNASEAIEGSGNITISTLNTHVKKPINGYENIKIGEYAVLNISDDGPGISSDHLARIFEPFYTNKVMGRSGTGLGLSVVWNTVKDHEGYVRVKNNENGITFQLYFPITRDEILNNELSKLLNEYRGNGETILVVDDMKIQREISCKIFETLGYKPIAVSCGEDAVDYLEEFAVDLLFLDMIMDPGINGRETYEKVLEIHPKQKAILVSGFGETKEVQKAKALGVGQYLRKPFTLENIGLAVKNELGKPDHIKTIPDL